MARPPSVPYPPRVPPPPSPTLLRHVRRALLAWYAVEHRDFPWRRTRDPYAVLVSEVMLQQTQAARVSERFERFMDRFPDVAALAAASQAAVLAEWSGLGYNRRAVALRRVAMEVTAHGWPREPAALERLPGIGPYTARAVASLAFGIPAGVVDTNVRRWLLRRFGVEDAAAGLQRLADALATADPGASPDEAAAWTHATMEFGASVCRSRVPACAACPIARGCPARGLGTRVPVARQPAFAGSRRALRGAVLKRLVATDGHAAPADLVTAALTAGAGRRDAIQDAIESLERDGLVHRRGEWLRLGAAGATDGDGSVPEAAATPGTIAS